MQLVKVSKSGPADIFFLRHIRLGYRKKHWHTLLLLHWEGAIAARTDEKCYHIETSVWVFPTKSVATIFQIKAKIALPFQSRLTTKVVQWQQGKPAKKCTVRSEFLFCLLSRFCRCCGCVKLLVALPRKTRLDMRRFRLKNRRFNGKHATTYCNDIDFRRYPYRGSHYERHVWFDRFWTMLNRLRRKSNSVCS